MRRPVARAVRVSAPEHARESSDLFRAMTDHFAVLNEPRRPWLDSEALKARFLALSSKVHPDRFHNADETERVAANQRYLELNSAFNCLRDHKERLVHLLELETGARPANTQRIPPGLMEIFMEVGRVCQGADAFLAEKTKATSPLARVNLFERGMEWADRLSVVLTRANSLQAALIEALKAIDAEWMSQMDQSKKAQLMGRLEQIYREFGYVNRWTAQLQERVVQLSF
jgi:curved DNA-binding protein CbpA